VRCRHGLRAASHARRKALFAVRRCSPGNRIEHFIGDTPAGPNHARTAIAVLALCLTLNLIGRGSADTCVVFLLPLESDLGWTRSFWGPLRIFFETSVGMLSVTVQSVAYLVEQGYPPLVAASAFGPACHRCSQFSGWSLRARRTTAKGRGGSPLPPVR